LNNWLLVTALVHMQTK